MEAITLKKEEFDALIAARDEALAERETLRGEVRNLKVERDLLQEKLTAFLRKLFDAKSEVRGTDQKDMFFNEAEVLAPVGSAVAEESPWESRFLHIRARSAGASRSIRICRVTSCAMNYRSRNGFAPTTARC
jgi:FtsZ-binding cell division protein ZapB